MWYLSSAKCDVPLTVDEARVLWKMHKQSANCVGHRWRRIARKSGKLLGFECECGFRYEQKRRLAASSSPRSSS